MGKQLPCVPGPRAVAGLGTARRWCLVKAEGSALPLDVVWPPGSPCTALQEWWVGLGRALQGALAARRVAGGGGGSRGEAVVAGSSPESDIWKEAGLGRT